MSGVNMKTAIGRLRITGFLEAISWLLLLFVAMPLKYMAAEPLMVKYVGWIHGLLFIIYVVQLLNFWSSQQWKSTFVLKGFVAAFLPFGTLIFDKKLSALEIRNSTTH